MFRRIALLFVLFSMMMSACTSPITAQSPHFRLAMSLEQVGIGKRPITIMINDLDGNPIRDATVTLLPVMRQHGMLSPPQTVQSEEPGRYVFRDINLDMSGEWQMQVTIEHESVIDMVEIPVMIE